MKQVETEGETLDAAIAKAVSLLGVDRDKVSLDILAEEKIGVLGFGRQNARVRATIREAVTDAPVEEDPGDSVAATAPPDAPSEAVPAQAEAIAGEPGDDEPGDEEPDDREAAGEPAHTDESSAEVRRVGVEVTEEILRLMGVAATVAVKPGASPSEFILDIEGDSSALLIGRRGQTLEALQHIVARIVAEKVGPDGPQPVVDVEDYRGRRVRSLEDMALRLGEKAKRSRKSQGIDALSARDRRTVHLALKDDPWLVTKSLGQGAYRRLLIIPEGDRKAPETDSDKDESHGE